MNGQDKDIKLKNLIAWMEEGLKDGPLDEREVLIKNIVENIIVKAKEFLEGKS